MNLSRRALVLLTPLIAVGILASSGVAQAEDNPSDAQRAAASLTPEQNKQKAEQGFLTPTAQENAARQKALSEWRRHTVDREPGPDGKGGGKGQVLGTRPATQEDVQSGLAASTLATIYICSGGANLRDPVDDTIKRSVWLGLGWEEGQSSTGKPTAKVNTGNAIFVHNDGTRVIYWSAEQWMNAFSTPDPKYSWVRWAYNQTAYNAVGTGGGQLGMRVLSNGYVDQGNPGSTWYNQEVYLAGLRTAISNNGGLSLPDLHIYLWGSGSYASSNSHSEVFVEATNESPCGYLHTFNY